MTVLISYNRLQLYVNENPTATMVDLARWFGLEEPKQTVQTWATIQVTVAAEPPAEWAATWVPDMAHVIDKGAFITYTYDLRPQVKVPPGQCACDGPLSDHIDALFKDWAYPEGSYWVFDGQPRCENCR